MATQSKPVLNQPQLDDDQEERDDAVIGVALRWSLAVLLTLVVVGGGFAYWLTRPEPPPRVNEAVLANVAVREAPKVEIPTVAFTDVTKAAGINFVHENGAAGEKLLPETMGGGCAFFDFDNDGDQDLLLINSRRWPWDPRPVQAPATSALYRNDGHGEFENVTAGSGLDVSLYGQGVACGDFDNDGRVDVFVSALGANRLFRNVGDGTFEDVTDAAGGAGNRESWSTSCGFFDYDNDGDLDLFVCNYVAWSREFDAAQDFQLTGGGRAYGRPQNFEGAFSYLYRNDGGKFTDVSAEAGVQVRNAASTQAPMGKSLGVTFADVDRDGWLDIVVANDTVQNFLFHNQQNGKFQEIGSLAGVAFDMDGAARGAMGIDAARFRNNDALGVAIGNFANEMTALYVAYDGAPQFTDEAVSTGLGPSTRLELTFGVLFTDYDLDGRLDLLAANGHLEEDINRVQPSQHYEQPPHLFWNCGPEHGTEFMPVPPEKCGSDFLQPMVGRGSSCADIDNDGDVDVLLMGCGQAPRLLRNDQNLGHHWLRVKLIGKQCNRDAIGAWVEVKLPDRTLWRQVMPTRGYLSQSELPVAFGLGKADRVEEVIIHWPNGAQQKLENVSADAAHTVQQAESPILLPKTGERGAQAP
jgi:hypothetical protein